MPNVPKFPVIGGPLDGEHANQKDFWPAFFDSYSRRINTQGGNRWIQDRPEGKFFDYRDEYKSYNNAIGRRDSEYSSMIWMHKSLLRPSIREPQ